MKLQLPRPSQEDIGLNLTPLIDVVFLLLIFLLVTTTFTRTSVLEIEMPTVQTEQSLEPANIEVWIQPSGDIWIDGVLRQQSQTLEQMLGDALGQRPEAQIVIMADPVSPAQAVLDVLSASGALNQTRVLFSGVYHLED